MGMARVLFYVLSIALTVFALIDSIQTEDERVRGLPKIGWIILIVLVPFAGPIAWLLAGKQRAARPAGGPGVPWRPTTQPPPRIVAPDDDPEFLRQLNTGNKEHERMLKKWEEDLKRREEEMRGDGDEDTAPGGKP
jgi:hypothetical protein